MLRVHASVAARALTSSHRFVVRHCTHVHTCHPVAWRLFAHLCLVMCWLDVARSGSGHCARGLGCHFAHTSAAVSVPASPANRPGMAATYPHQAAATPLPHHDARVLVAMLQQQTAQVPQMWQQPCAIVRGFLSPQSPLQQQAPQPIARSLSLQHPSAVARSPGLQRASSFSAPSSAASAAASACNSCKLCVSNLPPSLFSQPRLTEWFAAFGEVSSLTMMPPDRCIVQFATHHAALAAFGVAADRERPVLGDAAIRVQWVVPKGTNAAACAGAAAATALPVDERTEEVTVISSRSGKEITLTRKVRPPQLIAPDAAANPHLPLQRAASTSAFLMRDASNSAPQLTRPLSASAVLVSHSHAHAASSVPQSAAAAAVPVAAASPLRARSYSNGSVGAPVASPVNPHSTATVASLRALLGQTEGVLARLAASSSPADSDSMQRSLRAKISALRIELERRGCAEGSAGFASAVSAPTLVGVSVAPAPLSLPLPLFGSSPSHAHSALVSGSPTRSSSVSCSSGPVGVGVAEQLRLQRESALRAQLAQSRALHSKQRLDEEMDALRKEAQLSSICEMEENSLDATNAGEDKI